MCSLEINDVMFASGRIARRRVYWDMCSEWELFSNEVRNDNKAHIEKTVDSDWNF